MSLMRTTARSAPLRTTCWCTAPCGYLDFGSDLLIFSPNGRRRLSLVSLLARDFGQLRVEDEPGRLQVERVVAEEGSGRGGDRAGVGAVPDRERQVVLGAQLPGGGVTARWLSPPTYTGRRPARSLPCGPLPARGGAP